MRTLKTFISPRFYSHLILPQALCVLHKSSVIEVHININGSNAQGILIIIILWMNMKHQCVQFSILNSCIWKDKRSYNTEVHYMYFNSLINY